MSMLCSFNPMGNYVARGKVNDEPKAVAQLALSQLLNRRARGDSPDFGLALPAEYWHKNPRYGLLKSLLWNDNNHTNDFVPYEELTNDAELVFFWQAIGTNGGHRTDFKVRRVASGEYQYEISVPLGPFQATGSVSKDQLEQLCLLMESGNGTPLISDGSHDSRYHTLFFKNESGIQYHQCYGEGDYPSVKMQLLESLYRWTPRMEALEAERAFFDKKSANDKDKAKP